MSIKAIVVPNHYDTLLSMGSVQCDEPAITGDKEICGSDEEHSIPANLDEDRKLNAVLALGGGVLEDIALIYQSDRFDNLVVGKDGHIEFMYPERANFEHLAISKEPIVFQPSCAVEQLDTAALSMPCKTNDTPPGRSFTSKSLGTAVIQQQPTKSVKRAVADPINTKILQAQDAAVLFVGKKMKPVGDEIKYSHSRSSSSSTNSKPHSMEEQQLFSAINSGTTTPLSTSTPVEELNSVMQISPLHPRPIIWSDAAVLTAACGGAAEALRRKLADLNITFIPDESPRPSSTEHSKSKESSTTIINPDTIQPPPMTPLRKGGLESSRYAPNAGASREASLQNSSTTSVSASETRDTSLQGYLKGGLAASMHAKYATFKAPTPPVSSKSPWNSAMVTMASKKSSRTGQNTSMQMNASAGSSKKDDQPASVKRTGQNQKQGRQPPSTASADKLPSSRKEAVIDSPEVATGKKTRSRTHKQRTASKQKQAEEAKMKLLLNNEVALPVQTQTPRKQDGSATHSRTRESHANTPVAKNTAALPEHTVTVLAKLSEQAPASTPQSCTSQVDSSEHCPVQSRFRKQKKPEAPKALPVETKREDNGQGTPRAQDNIGSSYRMTSQDLNCASVEVFEVLPITRPSAPLPEKDVSLQPAVAQPKIFSLPASTLPSPPPASGVTTTEFNFTYSTPSSLQFQLQEATRRQATTRKFVPASSLVSRANRKVSKPESDVSSGQTSLNSGPKFSSTLLESKLPGKTGFRVFNDKDIVQLSLRDATAQWTVSKNFTSAPSALSFGKQADTKDEAIDSAFSTIASAQTCETQTAGFDESTKEPIPNFEALPAPGIKEEPSIPIPRFNILSFERGLCSLEPDMVRGYLQKPQNQWPTKIKSKANCSKTSETSSAMIPRQDPFLIVHWALRRYINSRLAIDAINKLSTTNPLSPTDHQDTPIANPAGTEEPANPSKGLSSNTSHSPQIPLSPPSSTPEVLFNTPSLQSQPLQPLSFSPPRRILHLPKLQAICQYDSYEGDECLQPQIVQLSEMPPLVPEVEPKQKQKQTRRARVKAWARKAVKGVKRVFGAGKKDSVVENSPMVC